MSDSQAGSSRGRVRWGGSSLCECLKGGGLGAQGGALHELFDALAELLGQSRDVLPCTYNAGMEGQGARTQANAL